MKYKIYENIITHFEENKEYLMNSVTGKVIELNNIASYVLQNLMNNKSMNEILNDICNTYIQINREDIEKDINLFLEKLEKDNYIFKTNELIG